MAAQVTGDIGIVIGPVSHQERDIMLAERRLHRVRVENTLLIGNTGDAPVSGDVNEHRATVTTLALDFLLRPYEHGIIRRHRGLGRRNSP